MKNRNQRILAYAVALSLSAAAPHWAYAAPTIESVTTAGDDLPAAEDAAEEKMVPGKETPDLTGAQQSSVPVMTEAEKRTQQWQLERPAEEKVYDYMKPLEGKTIVDIQFEGAGETTLPTVKAAVSQQAGDIFTTQAAEADRVAIFDTGYFYDLYPSVEEIPEGIVITYHLLENPVLTEVVFTGNTVEPSDKLRKLIQVRDGAILNNVHLHDGVAAIQEEYRKDGYILAKISDLDINPNGVLTLKINEGMLEGYAVKGNKKTKDRVILREMRQPAGEPFNAKLAKRSMQRVYNLGFFEDVNIKMNPGVEPNAVVMEVDVKEKRTGTFGFGAGYSSADGVIGMLSLSDTNFRGIGDAVSVSFEKSGSGTDAHGYTFSYRRPWLDKKETAVTFRLYDRTYKFSDYDSNGDFLEAYMRRYVGGEITFSRPSSEYTTNYITLRQRKDSYEEHEESGNAGDRSKDWAWQNANFGMTRSIILQHITDTRDNVYNPTTGVWTSYSAEIAGLGDFNFQKVTLDEQHYYPVGHAQVFASRYRLGVGRGDISEFNQYRLGGQNSIRGYRDDQFRGNRMFAGTLEYRFPLHKKVQGAIFTDFGNAWNDGFNPHHIYASIGFGVALNTPLGPLRLDYGRGSQGGRVHFSVGGTF